MSATGNPGPDQFRYYEGTVSPRKLAQLQSNVTASKVNRLAAAMVEYGYQGAPIETMPVADSAGLGVTDGTHRRRAAIRAGLKSVPVYGVSPDGVPEGMREITRGQFQAYWEQAQLERRTGMTTVSGHTASAGLRELGEGSQVSPEDRPSPQQLYHGTRAALKRGDLIEPGHPETWPGRSVDGLVYFTDSAEDARIWGGGPGREAAEKHFGVRETQHQDPVNVYVVKPTGEYEPDANFPARIDYGRICDPGETDNEVMSWQSRHSLRVVAKHRWSRLAARRAELVHEQISDLPGSNPDGLEPEKGKTAAYDAPDLRRTAGSIRMMSVSQLMDLHSVNDVNAKVRDRPPIGIRLHDPRLDEAICNGTVAPVHVTDKFGAVREYGAVMTGAEAGPTDTRFLGNGHYRVHRADELGVTYLPVTDNKLLSDFPVRRKAAVSYGLDPAAQLDVPEGSPATAAGGPPRPTPPRRPGSGVTRGRRPRSGA